MNIVRENLEDLTTLLKVTVGEADYNEAVDKSLRTYRRKANIPGFRPGMVPMGIINKMYRKGVVAEEAYRTASKACFDYIETEKLTTVGDMIPSQKQQPLDFDNDTEYEFVFEVGIAPEVQISLSKKDKVTKYTIRVEEKNKKLLVYDPSIHDYSVEKPVWEEIANGHFVYGNQRELEGYRKEYESQL